ncbi:MAG: ABC transporter ATP-binding protein [Hydrogenophilus thermoluteolus]
MLTVEGLTITLANGTEPLVSDLTFSIAAGETLALVGESGSGKSLTAQALLGLLPTGVFAPALGQATLSGISGNLLVPDVAARVRGAHVAMIFQEPMSALNPVMTVGAQIAEVLEFHAPHLSPLGRQAAVAAALTEVQLDAERIAASYPHQLSGGQRQRAMIAMALVAQPKLLIADEPTTALDVTVQAEILQLLRTLQRRHAMAMLFITHDLDVVAQVADRVAVMQAGRIVEMGTVAEVTQAPKHPYTRRLWAAQPRHLPHGPKGCRQTGVSTSASPNEADTACAAVPSDLILDARNLRVYFPIQRGVLRRTVGYVKALDGVDLTIRRGEVVAVVGESGSGKSTLGRAVLGLQPLTAGTLSLFGIPMQNRPRHAWQPVRRRVQVVFQDPFASLNPKRRIGALITEPMAVHRIGVDDADRWQRAQAWVTALGLPAETLQRYPHEFSGGQRQRIAIAKALALEPELLVCDEITSALDVTLQAEILQRLAHLVVERGLSLLFITHNMAVVEYLADRVVVLYRGKVVESGETATVLNRPEHPYTQQLLTAAGFNR